MESLVIVACTVSLTLGYPMTDFTVSDAFDVARNWSSTRSLENPDNNRESVETGLVDATFVDDESLRMGEKTNLPKHTESTTYATDKLTIVNDVTESRGQKLGHESNLEQISENDVSHQDLFPTRINEEYVTGVNLDTLARHVTDLDLQSVSNEEVIDAYNGSPVTDRHATSASSDSVQSERQNIEQMETEEGYGQPMVTVGVDREDLTRAATFVDDNSDDEVRSLETSINFEQTEEKGDGLTLSDKEAEFDAVDSYHGTKGITDADFEIKHTQPEVNQTRPEVSKTQPKFKHTDTEVDNLMLNDTESIVSRKTTPGLGIDKWRSSQEHSKSTSTPTGSGHSFDVVSTFTFPISNESIYERLNILVSSLEQLRVLDPVGRCYSVDRITKTSVTGSPELLRIELFIETRLEAASTPTYQEDLINDGASETGNETDTTSGGGAYSGEEEDCFVNGTGVHGRRISGNRCVPLVETDSGNLTDGGLNETLWDSVNRTELHRKSVLKPNNEQQSDNGALKPSRTQILVISTCSTVIGLFFIVALIMRIRNYLKRTRTLNKHRSGLRPHSRQHIASALTNDPTALALPPRTPPIDCQKQEVVVKHKETSFHPRRNRRLFFAGSRSSSSSSGSRDHNISNNGTSSSRPVSAFPPMMPQLRRQSDLSRFFISQRTQRETAKEYIRQLSLSQAATPSNALFVGTSSYFDEPPSPPHDASRKLLPLSSETYQKLDMA